MFTLLLFPLRNDLPQYSFSITLTGVIFTFQMLFNVRMNRWIMNINDSAGNQILSGIPLLIDTNLTYQYATLAIPAGILFCGDNTNQDMQPTLNSFGLTNTCYYVDPGMAA